MTRRRRLLQWITALVVLSGGLAYLYDPPWIGELTSGLGPWQSDAAHMRYRWSNGHASFFVPSDAVAATLPLRTAVPNRGRAPVTVRVSVDDRPVDQLVLADRNEWVTARILLPRHPTRRRYRRLDLRVSQTVGPSNLGVQLGEVSLERAGS